MTKLIFTIGFLIITGFASIFETDNSRAIMVSSNSSLQIYGTTNFNDFNCVLNFEEVNSILRISYEEHGNRLNFTGSYLKLQNNCFDCGNRMMNNDFLEMLNTDSYPHVTLELIEIVVNPRNPQEVFAYTGITMAGCTKTFSIPLTIKKESMINAKGCLSFKLTDFGITPPKKAMGLVVVSDEVDINLDLNIQLLN